MTTSPEIVGLAEGCNVVGDMLGDVDGEIVGDDEMKTGALSTVH